MVKEKFRVTGKQHFQSRDGKDYYSVYIISHFPEGADSVGDMCSNTMVTKDEYNNILPGRYEGFIVRSGRYINVDFSNFLGE